MDIVLGVSIAPTSVHMVMLQGENADGATIDENEFPVTVADDSPTVSASDRVIAAIMCTREDAADAGLELDSIGVAFTDQLEAAVLRDALAAHKIENVLLVSAFLAAAALTQSVGGAMGYERTAVLFVEPDTATLALVDTADGSVDDVHEEQFGAESGQLVTAELMELVAGLDKLPTPPGGLFVVGSGVDVTAIRRRLEEATSLIVNTPEEPETALARGAALASANALASPTAAWAYAQDPGTGALTVSALPEYLSVTESEPGNDDLAYSAVADDEADAATVIIDASDDGESRSRPALLVGSVVAIAGFSAALALEIALSLGIQTTVSSLPAPIKGIIAPVQQALLPAPDVAALKLVAPKPLNPPPVAPPAAPVPAAPPVVLPAAPPVVVPAAPGAPVPVFIPPIAPVPVPPVRLPDPPASPPVVEAPPPIYVPPPKSPPHRLPPDQSPPPSAGGGGGPAGGGGPVRGNPGSGGPRGPGHGNPGGPTSGGPTGGGPTGGGPTSGGPATGPGTGQGAPGSGPTGGGQTPSGGAPAAGGPSSGGASPGGGAPSAGGPTGGGETPTGGGPTGGGPTSSGPSGGSTTGGETPSGGGSTSASGPTGGGEVSGGSSSGSSESSGGGSTSGGSSSGESSSGGSSSGSSSESSGGSSSSGSSSSGSESSGGSSSSSSSGGSSSSR